MGEHKHTVVCCDLVRAHDSSLWSAGLGAVASYGTVSNITYGGGLAVSWIAFVKQTGLSPLMPGQWKNFLAFYAGAPSPAHAGSS